MADQNIDIKTKAKKVTNEKSAEQDSELAELKKKKDLRATLWMLKQQSIAKRKATRVLSLAKRVICSKEFPQEPEWIWKISLAAR